jgi:hypothetical protein
MDEKELTSRSIMVRLLDQARSDVESNRIPDQIRNELPLKNLEDVAASLRLKKSAAHEFLACAIALHRATLKDHKALHSKSSTVRSEIKKIRAAATKLKNLLKSSSYDARLHCCPEPIEESTAEGVTLSIEAHPFEWLLPQLETFIEVINNVEVPNDNPGKARSPEYLTLLHLGRLLGTKSGTRQRQELKILATEVLEPILDLVSPKDGKRWRDLIKEVAAELNASSRG